MFEQTFKNIDDILHKDSGCGSELDYVEQTSWILFLKYLDDLEKDKYTEAQLSGTTYQQIIGKKCQWHQWAAAKLENNKFFNSLKISPILYSMVLAFSAFPLNFLK
jgi:type I restriction enzyme M protein